MEESPGSLRTGINHSLRFGSLYADIEERMQSLRTGSAEVRRSRDRVEQSLRDGSAYYGINTGFGVLASRRIPDEDLARLQHNLLLSHAVGVGDPIPKDVTRLMLQLKIHALAQGFSGVSSETFNRLLLFEENDWVPVVPSKGSVGASGDLAPLAHLALPLLGLGDFWMEDGTGQIAAESVLAAADLKPIQLQAKDGLALINGTQMMSAYGAFLMEDVLTLLKTADVLAAMSLEALQGSIKPFDMRVHNVRPHPGQTEVASNVLSLLMESEILESHRHCGKVQDPYCLRCVPQVHGASRDALRYVRSVVETEINSVTDNPLVFENRDIISGGNFHGQPLAIAFDTAAIALAELANISERRTYLLLAGHDGLPELLMKETGINSGFMLPQYTAAALVSENKILCHPASVDSIPTSLGQEDHVSMGSVGALKLYRIWQNVQHVLGIELFTAAQALDFRLPLRPGRGVENAHRFIRQRIAHAEADHFFQHEIAVCRDVVSSGALVETSDLGQTLV